MTSDERERIAVLEAKLDDLRNLVARIVDDHEKRLRGMERFRYAWPGSGLILAALGVLAAVLHH